MHDGMHAEMGRLEETYWWFVAKNRIVLDLVRRFHQPHYRTACDIGCGCGGVLARLARRYDAVGLDMHPYARDACAARGLRARDGSLPDHLPFAPRSFDVVVCSEVIEHVEDDFAAARAVVGLLRPGGLLVTTVPAHQWMWSQHDVLNHHFRRYTRRTFMQRFVDLPVEPLVCSYANMLTFPAMAAARLAGRFMGSRSLFGSGGGSIRPLSTPVNRLLTSAFAGERHLMPHRPLPMGSSVVCVFRARG